MTNITRFNFPNNKKITAIKADTENDFLWMAFAKNSQGNCILRKTGKFKPSQTHFSMDREVEEITAMDLNASFLWVAYDDSEYLGERFLKTNPLTTFVKISKGSYIESPVDVMVQGSNIWFLLPGNLSGENTKLLRYDATSSIFQEEVDLIKSGITVTDAHKMSADSSGDIWISINANPGSFVRVFLDEGDYDFTVYS